MQQVLSKIDEKIIGPMQRCFGFCLKYVKRVKIIILFLPKIKNLSSKLYELRWRSKKVCHSNEEYVKTKLVHLWFKCQCVSKLQVMRGRDG